MIIDEKVWPLMTDMSKIFENIRYFVGIFLQLLHIMKSLAKMQPILLSELGVFNRCVGESVCF